MEVEHGLARTGTVVHDHAEVAQTLLRRDLARDGQQVADFVCFRRPDTSEKLSVHNTALIQGTIYISTGHQLLSDRCGTLMTITADTCGLHDLLAGSCSEGTNRWRYGVADTPNCRSNFEAALRPFGIPMRHRESGLIATYQYHSPFRRYYIARNNIDLILRNVLRRPRWVGAVLRREMGGMIVSMVSGPQRIAQVLAITTGTVHGLVRRRGMIPGWLKSLIT